MEVRTTEHNLQLYIHTESDRWTIPCNWLLDYSAVSTYCLDDLQSISPYYSKMCTFITLILQSRSYNGDYHRATHSAFVAVDAMTIETSTCYTVSNVT